MGHLLRFREQLAIFYATESLSLKKLSSSVASEFLGGLFLVFD